MEMPKSSGSAAPASQALTAAAGAATTTASEGQPHLAPDTRLYGHRLRAARVAWAVTAAILIGSYLLLLPASLDQLRTVCTHAPCARIQPTPASVEALHRLGFSTGGFAALTVGLIVLSSLICFAVNGVIVWRKSDDWMALLVALAGIALGTELIPYLVQVAPSAWQVLALVLNALDFALLFLVFALFPTGRLVPRWILWIVAGWIATSAALIISYLLTGELLFTASTLVWLVVLSAVVAAQVYRYRAVSLPQERAQTRWVIFGGVIALGIVLADFVPTYVFPALGQPGSLYLLLSAPIYTVPIILFSICLGVAVLRFRLYDIDIIIRRTLIYGILTGTLATIYAIAQILLQASFQTLTGQGSALAVVGSTLAIAVLFQPVRSRVQAEVDRRFYRRKYDAARTVAAFGATLRGEMDLAQLSEQLLDVVDETMRPAHLSLWMRGPQRAGGHDHVPAQAESGPGQPANATE